MYILKDRYLNVNTSWFSQGLLLTIAYHWFCDAVLADASSLQAVDVLFCVLIGKIFSLYLISRLTSLFVLDIQHCIHLFKHAWASSFLAVCAGSCALNGYREIFCWLRYLPALTNPLVSAVGSCVGRTTAQLTGQQWIYHWRYYPLHNCC